MEEEEEDEEEEEEEGSYYGSLVEGDWVIDNWIGERENSFLDFLGW